MVTKYFCDRCGKEAKELYGITVYSSFVGDSKIPVFYRHSLCKNCCDKLLNNIEKAILF